MKKNKGSTLFLTISGAIIFGVFVAVSIINIVDIDSYQLSTDIIRDIDYIDGKLVVTARDDMVSVCDKQTKMEPVNDSLCWIDTVNNKAIISIYEYKTYYIWTKDLNGIISFYNKYNSKNN